MSKSTIIAAGLGIALLNVACDGGKDRAKESSATSTTSRIESTKPSPRKDAGVTRATSPNSKSYTIGDVDPRFGITKRKLLRLIDEAIQVWEKPVHVKLFRYDSAADLKINMQFDERQASVIEAKRLRSHITLNGKSFNELKQRYDSQIELVEAREEQFKSEEAEFNGRLDKYNYEVETWNNKGGVPPDKIEAVDRERSRLEFLKRDVDHQRVELNEAISSVNELADSIKEIAAKYNLAVEYYNDEFITVREFEKGVWNGRVINIFEFENDNDLRITLVHELGHVLGFGHVDDPKAIMYYKLGKQNIRHLRLTEEDRKLLFAKFPPP